MPDLIESDLVAYLADELLSSMAFMSGALARPEEIELAGDSWLRASLPITGGEPCEIEIGAAPAFVCEAAVNMAMLIEPELALDCLGELLNIFAGQVVSDERRPLGDHDLGLPSVVAEPSESWRALADDEATIAILAETHIVLVRIGPPREAAS